MEKANKKKLNNKLQEVCLFMKREGFFSLLLKLSDFILRSLGISFFSLRKAKYHGLKENNEILFKDRNVKNIFIDIYQNEYWKKNYSLSGSGSELDEKSDYVINLKKLLKELNFSSIFDLPCGDMSWMKFVINDLKIDYIGGDIVPELVNKNNQNFEKLKFIEFDIINSTDYPKVELIHIKDCLFHFSFKDIVRVINSLKKSNIKKMLLTSHKSKILKNLDIQTGDFRYLDLEKKPFNFPKPKKRVKDFKFGEFPKYVNLWNIDEIPNFPNEE